MITRFAPSPTGFLHLGHAYAALVAHHFAAAAGGKFLVRMEDIDHTRVRESYYQAILSDLAWLGISWEEPVWRQLDRLPNYAAAKEQLTQAGVLYPCFCTRKDLATGTTPFSPDLNAPQEGSEMPRYAKRCTHLSPTERTDRLAAGEAHAWRLHADRAWQLVGPCHWLDRRFGRKTVTLDELDDAVLARKDIGTSYHLAVVVDDAAQGITLVTRGEDLLEATPIHRILQALLQLPVPEYFHHGLIRDPAGKRLAKRDAARTLQSLRESGHSPASVREMLVGQAGDGFGF